MSIITTSAKFAINRLLQLNGSHIYSNYDPKRTIFICGSGRSGTTWLAEQIAYRRGIMFIWEPFEPSSSVRLKDLNFGYDPEINNINDLDRDHFKYIDSFMRGVDLGIDQLRFTTNTKLSNATKIIQDIIFFDRLVVKCVRANFAVHAIQRHYGCKSIFVTRHPCGVINSQQRFAWQDALSWKDRWLNILVQRAPQLIPLMNSLSSDIEVLAFDWAVSNSLPFYQNDNSSIYFAEYEELLRLDSGAFELLMANLDLKESNISLNQFYRPSSTAGRQLTDFSGFNPTSWMQEMSISDQRSVLHVVQSVAKQLPDNLNIILEKYL